MDIGVLVLEALVFALLFTAGVFNATRHKDDPSNIHNYPEDIQEEYFKTHERMDVSYKNRKVILTKSIGILLFTAILAACTRLAGGRTFLDGFLVGCGLMVFIGCYDTFFIDWILFANMKIFRLEGTEHMDEAYHQKWFHLKGILFPGSLFMVIVGLLVGLVTMLIS